MALAFLQSEVSSSNETVYTFSSQSLGSAAADRYIIVGVTGRGTVGGGVASATIGGVAAAIDVQVTNSTSGYTTSAIIKANVPTGTTGDVVITFSNAMLRAGIGMWRADSLTSATPTDTDSSTADAPSVNLDVNSGGYVIACAYSADSAGGPQTTWTNLTERYDQDVEGASGSTQSGADTTSGSTQTLTCTATFDTPLTCAGAFSSYGVAVSSLSPSLSPSISPSLSPSLSPSVSPSLSPSSSLSPSTSPSVSPSSSLSPSVSPSLSPSFSPSISPSPSPSLSPSKSPSLSPSLSPSKSPSLSPSLSPSVSPSSSLSPSISPSVSPSSSLSPSPSPQTWTYEDETVNPTWTYEDENLETL